MKRHLVCALLGGVLFSAIAPAQATFEEAVALYDSAKYKEAALALGKFANENPQDARVTDAEYYVCMCLFNQGSYHEFDWAAYVFSARYPSNPHVEQIAYHKSGSQKLDQAIDAAIERCRALLAQPPDDVQAERAQYDLGILYHLTDDGTGKGMDPVIKEYLAYLDKYPQSERVPIVRFRLGKAYGKSGNPDAAIQAWNTCLTEYPWPLPRL